MRSDDIADIGTTAGVASDVGTSRRVAAWAYGNALAAGARAWLRPSQYESIDKGYVALFEV